MTLCSLLHFDSRTVSHEGIGVLPNGADRPRGISIRNDERLLAHNE